MRRFLALLLFLAFFAAAPAQAQAVLTVSPSPPKTAMGGLGVAVPTTDAHGFFYNPAHLGPFGREANLAVRAYPTSANWLSTGDLSTRSTALSAGYDFSPQLGVPLSAGVGYARSSFDLGTHERRNAQNEVVGTVELSDRTDAFSVGVGFGQLVNGSAGATLKRFQIGREVVSGDIPAVSSLPSANLLDVGALVSVPLVGRGPTVTGLDGALDERLALGAEAALGYAALNIGDELQYGERPADPLPRTARLGYGLTASLDYALGGTDRRVRLAEIGVSVEAEDDLRDCYVGGSRPCDRDGYQGPLGDIAPLDHVVAMHSSKQVTRRRGVRFDLAETLQIRRGGFRRQYPSLGEGGAEVQTRVQEATRGWGVRTEGTLTLLAVRTETPAFDVLAEHADLRYFHATNFAGSDRETTFHSLSLVVRGFR
jgi:hypothetical protein